MSSEDAIPSLSRSWTQSPLEEASGKSSETWVDRKPYPKSFQASYIKVDDGGLCKTGAATAHPSEDGFSREIADAIAAMTELDFHRRWDKAKQLARRFSQWGDRAIPALIYHLQDQSANSPDDPEIQWFLIRILSQFDRPDVVSAIAQILTTTPHDELRTAASKALTTIGSSAVTTLTALLSLGTPSEQRLLAARTLAHIRRSSTIVPLLSVAADDNSQVREVATEALGSFHDPRVTPVLLRALTDQPSIAIEAIRALSRRRDLLAEVDVVEALVNCLYRAEVSVAKESAMALGRLGGAAAAVALGKALGCPVATPIKLSVVCALGWIDHIAATRALTMAFDYDAPLIMPVVKQEIARALGQTQADGLRHQAAKPLIRWLQNCATRHESGASGIVKSDLVLMKQSVISALSRLNAINALDVLLLMLADDDARVRIHALNAMRQISPEQAQQKVDQYLERAQLSPALELQIRELVGA